MAPQTLQLDLRGLLLMERRDEGRAREGGRGEGGDLVLRQWGRGEEERRGEVWMKGKG